MRIQLKIIAEAEVASLADAASLSGGVENIKDALRQNGFTIAEWRERGLGTKRGVPVLGTTPQGGAS